MERKHGQSSLRIVHTLPLTQLDFVNTFLALPVFNHTSNRRKWHKALTDYFLHKINLFVYSTVDLRYNHLYMYFMHCQWLKQFKCTARVLLLSGYNCCRQEAFFVINHILDERKMDFS